MKIDFIINSLTGGGAERVMVTLANGLFKKHSIRIITFNEANGDIFSLNEDISRIKLHGGNFNNHVLRSFINLTSFYKKKTNRPDIIISFIHINNLISILAAKYRGIKIITSEHTNHTVVASRLVEFTRKYIYRFGNATTVLTLFDKSYYQKYGVNVSILPNPIIIPQNNKPFSKRRKDILLVGSLNRYEGKGFDTLLNLISPILKENPDWTLKIAGEGAKGLNVLQEITKKLDIQDKVLFIGFCSDIDGLMQDSQIFILPSKYEGLPMGLMEALSNGMACISYDCISGPSELIKNGQNGLLIENQNKKLMSEGIKNLISNEILRTKIANNAKESVRKYDLNQILNQWELLFQRVKNNER